MAANQGSRAGLITTVVILSTVSVVSTIFAFWYGAEKRHVEQDFADTKKLYNDLISPAAVNGPEVTALKTLRADPASGFARDTKVWDVALAQRDQLIKTVTGKDGGSDNTAVIATKAVADKLAAVNEAIKAADTRLASTSDNLLGAVDILADKVKSQTAALAERDSKLQAAEKRALDAVTQKETDLKTKDEQIEQIRAENDKSLKDTGDDRVKQQSVLAEIEKTRDAERKTFQETLSKKDVDVKSREQQIKSLEDRLKATQVRFDRIRVGVTSPILRHGDGVISSLSGKELVFINLGQGKQMVPGMTFEVYDKNRGIPKLGDAIVEEQPAGKASIEVVRILDDNSECRITRLAGGQQIMNGDVILNVVYDPSIKYNFYVFGRFDLDNNAVATLQDADVVKRLVRQWGAKITDKISVDTDFVVVGKEPVVPSFTADELTDPLNLKKQTDAQAELDQYLNVVQLARELHIPILNQNRFIYFTGQESLISR